MHLFVRYFYLTLLLSSSLIVKAQPFSKEIKEFARMDSLQAPVRNGILLIGSSSFTMWKDVQQWFPEHRIINRAFGGSTLLDQIRYVDQVVAPYHPLQVVIYCGENDIALSSSVTADTVLYRFRLLHGMIRDRYPSTRISFVSIKPSPSRVAFLPTVRQANDKIESFCQTEPKTDFINVFSSMLHADGSCMEDLFLSDRLHMNEKGYRIWQSIMKPYLLSTQLP